MKKVLWVLGAIIVLGGVVLLLMPARDTYIAPSENESMPPPPAPPQTPTPTLTPQGNVVAGEEFAHFYSRLKKSEQDCIVKALGEAKLNALRSGADEGAEADFAKIDACLASAQ